MCSLVVMNLMDRDSGVNNIWLDDLLLDNWLNGLMDVLYLCQFERYKK